MRVAFVSTMAAIPWGGSEELWCQSAKHLHKEGYKVSASVVWWPQLAPEVLAMKAQGIDVFLRRPAQHSLPVRLWRKIKRRFLAEEKNELQWLRLQKPDLVVISQGACADGVEWMKLCYEENLPFVAIVQCNNEVWWPMDSARGVMAMAYRSAKKVFCLCEHNLKLLEFQIGETLPNAKLFWNPFNAPTGPIPDWPKCDDVWRLACVGRLEPVQKGQDMLFEVLSRPVWRNRPIELNLYGSGPFEQSLRLLVDRFQLKNVHFRGHVKKLESIWDANHLLVLPSRYEGMPIVVMEAMWCARPTLVTDVGRTAEMCVDGETGFMAEAPTVNHLDQALERAWNQRHNWQRMGLAARARAEMLIPDDPVIVFCQELLECGKKTNR